MPSVPCFNCKRYHNVVPEKLFTVAGTDPPIYKNRCKKCYREAIATGEVLCLGISKRTGMQCRLRQVNGSDFCGIHQYGEVKDV